MPSAAGRKAYKVDHRRSHSFAGRQRQLSCGGGKLRGVERHQIQLLSPQVDIRQDIRSFIATAPRQLRKRTAGASRVAT